MIDKSALREISLPLLSSTTIPSQFMKASPLTTSATAAMDVAIHEDVASLKPIPDKLSYHP